MKASVSEFSLPPTRNQHNGGEMSHFKAEKFRGKKIKVVAEKLRENMKYFKVQNE